MMKKTVFLSLIALVCAAPLARAQELPKIAVYVTGSVHENEKQALGTRILVSLINSGHYMGIERSNSFLEEISKEQIKQRSGAIDDSQISQLGKQFGVKYICIADINPAFGSFQVSARIVDVETAVVVSIGETFSPLRLVDDFKRASDEVVSNMLKRQTAPASKPVRAPESASLTKSESAATIPQPDTVAIIKIPAPKPAVQKPSPASIPQRATPTKKSLKNSFWIGLGVDAVGAVFIAYGVSENDRASNKLNETENSNKFSEAKDIAEKRNNTYIIGAAALLAGISIQIFF
jgi:hypothetical protein